MRHVGTVNSALILLMHGENVKIPNFCLHLPSGLSGSAGALGVLSTALS